MSQFRFTPAVAILAMTMLSSCNNGSEKKELTREVFAAAVSKCQPMDARFVNNADGPPSVEITIPRGASSVPDCMAREFDGYALKDLQITYAGRNGV